MRYPLDATREDDDASDEISDASANDGHTEDAAKESASSVGQPALKTNDPQLNQFETPLGLDPTSTPDFVQHVGAFKAQLGLVQDALNKMRCAAQPAHASAAQPANSSASTAQAAAEEECFRAGFDLREIAQKLAKNKIEEKAKLLEDAANKAMFIPSNNSSRCSIRPIGLSAFPNSGMATLFRTCLNTSRIPDSLSKNSSKRCPIVMSSNISLTLTALPIALCRGVDLTRQNILSFSETP